MGIFDNKQIKAQRQASHLPIAKPLIPRSQPSSRRREIYIYRHKGRRRKNTQKRKFEAKNIYWIRNGGAQINSLIRPPALSCRSSPSSTVDPLRLTPPPHPSSLSLCLSRFLLSLWGCTFFLSRFSNIVDLSASLNAFCSPSY